MNRPAALSGGLVALALLSGCVPALREPPPLPAAGIEDQVEEIISLARERIWLSGHDPDPEARREAATGAVHAGQWCRSLRPDDPECAYWLGAALGVQARERRGTALDALPLIVELFMEAREGAPLMDRAGPDRALALLFLRAPGWPTGPGDPDLGLEHAEIAVGLEPGYAPNVLALAEALESMERIAESMAAYERAQSMAREASDRGDPDAHEWVGEAVDGLRRLGK